MDPPSFQKFAAALATLYNTLRRRESSCLFVPLDCSHVCAEVGVENRVSTVDSEAVSLVAKAAGLLAGNETWLGRAEV
jgi:hypothetical protein